MCGIAGIYALRGELPDTRPLNAMVSALRHRGPDDEGVSVRGDYGVGFAHTRLSVIDLSHAGHQPMWTQDEKFGIVYNGEIYNAPELRETYQRAGVNFRSVSDTEVLLEGFALRGPDVVDDLDGMFAFAVWDAPNACLWIVRDRFGEKPLYYWFDGSRGVFVFASELKALFAWDFIPKEIDPEALNLYLSLGYVPAPKTIFKGIHKLPPAHLGKVDRNGVSVHSYWKIEHLGDWKAPAGEYREAVRSALDTSVRRRMISDVPVGAYLSGGIDSTSIVGLMSRHTSHPVRTFTTAYDVGDSSQNYNVDAEMAELASKAFGTEHRRFTIEATAIPLQDLKDVVVQMDEPHANNADIATYLLAKEMHDAGVVVVLGGDGGDELFGGYARYRNLRYLSWLRRVPQGGRRMLLRASRMARSDRNLGKMMARAETPAQTARWYLEPLEEFSSEERGSLLTAPYQEGLNAPEQTVDYVLAGLPTADDADVSAACDLVLWIADQSNARADRMSMAHGVEARSPFLSKDVVEVALSIPFARKTDLRGDKRLLKEAMKDVLPPEIFRRPKGGWVMPYKFMIRGDLWPYVGSMIANLSGTGIFSSAVEPYGDAYVHGERRKLWFLLVFALWYEHYMSGDSSAGISRP